MNGPVAEASTYNDVTDFKLDSNALNQPPEEVFDIIDKLGEGSYGAVHKAVHKESGLILAIKQVPVDTDLTEIIKEISIMQQCDSEYVVKYYGSYLKNSDLWIVMEYCGAGSVSDIMRLRKKTLSAEQVAPIIRDTLNGLQYLHSRRKIHRDVKAGNILLNTEGRAKLADFGVAGQLTDTMAKRNTVIGTPFWMAPEVIQEIGHECKADIWSLGITVIELLEGRPPYADLHPMRAIFLIPTKPPPTLRNPEAFPPELVTFLSCCLVKNPNDRQSAIDLLEQPYIASAQPSTILQAIIEEAFMIAELKSQGRGDRSGSDYDSMDSATMVRTGADSSTLGGQQTVFHDDGTLVAKHNDNNKSPVSLDGSMRQYNTSEMTTPTEEQPYFMRRLDETGGGGGGGDLQDAVGSGSAIGGTFAMPIDSAQRVPTSKQSSIASHNNDDPHNNNFQCRAARPFADDDFDFLRDLSDPELCQRLIALDAEMDKEIEELKRRYQTKRQPIMDTIDQKKKDQRSF